MTPFSGQEDHIIRRMVSECREDCLIARTLSMQGTKRTVREVSERRRELGIEREWDSHFASKVRGDPTPEEIEERKRQIQESWGERERRKRMKGETSVAYEFPVYRISMEA